MEGNLNLETPENSYRDDLMGEEEEMNTKEYLGTFRWKRNLKFPILKSDIYFDYSILKGWSEYLEKRVDFEIEPYIVDAISYPMSVVYSLENLRKSDTLLRSFFTRENLLNVVIIGASSKAELRIAMESNYFDEIYNYLSFLRQNRLFKMNLYFVGEEIPVESTYNSKTNENLVYNFFKGKTGEFLKSNALEFSKTNTVFVGLNCGFGAGYLKLTMSWVQDLIKLFKFGFLAIFTYTNTWEDMIGEYAIIEKLLGGKIIIRNEENPFKSMTVYKNYEDKWSCGNYGYYIVGGTNSNKENLSKKTEEELKKISIEVLSNVGVSVK